MSDDNVVKQYEQSGSLNCCFDFHRNTTLYHLASFFFLLPILDLYKEMIEAEPFFVFAGIFLFDCWRLDICLSRALKCMPHAHAHAHRTLCY